MAHPAIMSAWFTGYDDQRTLRARIVLRLGACLWRGQLNHFGVTVDYISVYNQPLMSTQPFIPPG